MLHLFLDAVSVHGTPSQVRGDHGTENVRVAEWMEENQDGGRGSYIWGRFISLLIFPHQTFLQPFRNRSIHNSQVERIWYDVTEGFGGKWKDFFIDLEANEGLDFNKHAHIWLLHHLFLDDINHDALAWAETWNSHKLQIRGECQQTPQEMFFFSMLEDGPHGIHGLRQNREDRLDGEDITLYGIDWELWRTRSS